jgi:hypothetical protein
MTRLIAGLLVVAPGLLFGQSAFSGTWVWNPQSGQFSGKPRIFSLTNSTYHCDSCVPKINVPADGKDHRITGYPYADSINVTVVDDHEIEVVYKKDGKVSRKWKDTVSPDRNTLTRDWAMFPNGQEAHGKYVFTRTAPAPAGAHNISGSWQPQKLEDTSENIMKVTFQASDDELHMSDGIGDSYIAKFDGKDYPFNGDPGTTSVSVKKIDANTIEETDKHDGKVIVISRMTISPDGQVMTIENTNKLFGTNSKYEAKKQ